jgi:hypothetical protein
VIYEMVLQRLLVSTFVDWRNRIVVMEVKLKSHVLNLDYCWVKTFFKYQKLLASEEINGSTEKVFVAISACIGITHL